MLDLARNLAQDYFRLDFDVREILIKFIAREGGLDDAGALLEKFSRKASRRRQGKI